MPHIANQSIAVFAALCLTLVTIGAMTIPIAPTPNAIIQNADSGDVVILA